MWILPLVPIPSPPRTLLTVVCSYHKHQVKSVRQSQKLTLCVHFGS